MEINLAMIDEELGRCKHELGSMIENKGMMTETIPEFELKLGYYYTITSYPHPVYFLKTIYTGFHLFGMKPVNDIVKAFKMEPLRCSKTHDGDFFTRRPTEGIIRCTDDFINVPPAFLEVIRLRDELDHLYIIRGDVKTADQCVLNNYTRAQIQETEINTENTKILQEAEEQRNRITKAIAENIQAIGNVAYTLNTGNTTEIFDFISEKNDERKQFQDQLQLIQKKIKDTKEVLLTKQNKIYLQFYTYVSKWITTNDTILKSTEECNYLLSQLH